MNYLIYSIEPREIGLLLSEAPEHLNATNTRSVSSAEELKKAVIPGSGTCIILGSSIGSDASAAVLKDKKINSAANPIVCIVEDMGPARSLIRSGAEEVIAQDQLWKLPKVLSNLAEKVRLLRGKRSQEILLETMKRLSLSRSLPDIVDIVRHAARALAQADGATFILREGEQCHYVDEDAIGPLWKGQRFPMTACISGWAMLHGQTAAIGDILQDARIPLDAYLPTFVKSLIMTPIRAEKPVGAIGVYWSDQREFPEEEIELMRLLADSTALAMENVRAYSELERRVRDRTESLEAANRELEAFSYSVSHDLKSPLSVIMLNCETLKGGQPLDPDARRQLVEDIHASAEKMRRLTEDLLRMGKVSRSEIGMRPVDLSALARSTIEELRRADPSRRVQCIIEDGLRIMGDPGMIRIALENLIGNAWKYTMHLALPRIEIGWEEGKEGQPGAYYIRDNGIGFPMEEAGNLFRPFQRLPSSQAYPGTGVGLATVQRVIEKHGGNIWAESALGAGTTFRFRLPVRREIYEWEGRGLPL
jgi:signal transduction histidine kinase